MLFGKYVNKFYIKYFFLFFIGILSLIVVNIAQLYIPEYLGLAMDNMKDGIDYNEYLSPLLIKILLIAFIMWIGRFIWRVSLFGASNKIQYELRNSIFIKITKLSRNDFNKNKVGELMSLLSYDIETIGEVFGFGMIALVDCIFLGGFTIIKMFILDWRLSLFSLFPLICIAVLGCVIEKGMSNRYLDRQKSLDELSSFTQENFSGIRVIKAFVREKFETTSFLILGINCKNSDIKLSKYSALVDALISFFISIFVFIVLGLGGYFVYLSSTNQTNTMLSSGSIITFIGYFETLVWPLIAIGNVIVTTSKGKTSLKRVTKILDVEDEIIDGNESFNNEVKGKIEFKNLSFSYKGKDELALNNISFKINEGEKIGIVGRVGSGKTSIVDILLRFFNVEKGKVFIDDIDIMDLKVKDVRDNISYVPQDNFLFSDKVRNNIAFSNLEAPFEEIVNAASFASVDDNIINFDKGYDTITGEKGVSLSGGQRQRISIARAYLKDALIMIMDDSLSAVDLKTERQILANINKYRCDKTTILISSRVSTVKDLDKIIVLNNGEIEGFDTHENLLNISPTYKRMVEIQKLSK